MPILAVHAKKQRAGRCRHGGLLAWQEQHSECAFETAGFVCFHQVDAGLGVEQLSLETELEQMDARM